tara:strand:- start:628 stop:858 length:231 start_codon:yes stop_codon:yes gene_type:complete
MKKQTIQKKIKHLLYCSKLNYSKAFKEIVLFLCWLEESDLLGDNYYHTLGIEGAEFEREQDVITAAMECVEDCLTD